jgi:hypothetical protein
MRLARNLAKTKPVAAILWLAVLIVLYIIQLLVNQILIGMIKQIEHASLFRARLGSSWLLGTRERFLSSG